MIVVFQLPEEVSECSFSECYQLKILEKYFLKLLLICIIILHMEVLHDLTQYYVFILCLTHKHYFMLFQGFKFLYCLKWLETI